MALSGPGLGSGNDTATQAQLAWQVTGNSNVWVLMHSKPVIRVKMTASELFIL